MKQTNKNKVKWSGELKNFTKYNIERDKFFKSNKYTLNECESL